ncbi:hypothetical protein [Oceanisphaera sp. IT1-181]|uniref:hypothetical protein n=1 Tax=Oceanisphaera sp. IT1-181 TaxID=3081199 RepID=UPI0029C9CDB4|nr:hypothetical protein [Oceanisphaera sp. IT1-181]
MRERLTGPKLGQILVVLVILTSAFVYKTYKDGQSSTTSVSANVELCDIGHEKCTLEQGDLSAVGQLTADKLQPESSFMLSVSFSDPDVKVLKSRLEGHSMYMGTLPALLKQTAPGEWQGQAMVGACTERQMIWAWVLEVEHEGQTQQFKFFFEVKR